MAVRVSCARTVDHGEPAGCRWSILSMSQSRGVLTTGHDVCVCGLYFKICARVRPRLYLTGRRIVCTCMLVAKCCLSRGQQCFLSCAVWACGDAHQFYTSCFVFVACPVFGCGSASLLWSGRPPWSYQSRFSSASCSVHASHLYQFKLIGYLPNS